MMKHIFSLLLLLVSSVLQAQIIMKSGDGLMLLPEIGALLKEEKGNDRTKAQETYIKVERILPIHTKAEVSGTALKAGDEIEMVNREKVTSIKQLKLIYDSLKAGDEFKMLFRNTEGSFMGSFKKLSTDNNKGKFIVTTTPENDVTGSAMPFVLPELNAIFENQPKGVTVVGLMQRKTPGLPEAKAGEGPIFDDDIAIKLDGEKIRKTDELRKAYDKVKVGAKATLTIRRKNKTIEIPFIKESGEQRRIILN